MAFKNAQQARVWAGSLNYSGFTTKVQFPHKINTLDVTTIADTSKKFIVGQDESSFSIDLILDTDTTAGGLWSNATAWKTSAPLAVTYGPSGTTTGAECFMARGLQTSFTQSSKISDKVTASLNAVDSDGYTDFGTIVEDLTVISATGNGTARDGGASSANGGVGHLHVTAFSGVTNDVVTIEHSVDGSTSWNTLVTFTTVTGLTSEAVVVAAGTTVRRFLRVVDTLTGTPTLTRGVAFGRR